MFRTKLLTAVAAGAALALAACDARTGNGADANRSAEGKAEEGRLTVHTPGMDLKVNIPAPLRRGVGMHGEGDLVYPGSTMAGVHVESGPDQGEHSQGGVELTFHSADAPDQVARPGARAPFHHRLGDPRRRRNRPHRHHQGRERPASNPPRSARRRRHRRPGGNLARQLMAEPLADPKEVRAYLVAAARAGVALSYGELLEHLGYRFSRPKMRQLCAMLGAIDGEAQGRGEPELAVLVVRASDGLPGQGWWVAGGGSSRGYDGQWEGPEAARFIKAVQVETFAFWRSPNGTGARARPR
jgi:hypothetical protein